MSQIDELIAQHCPDGVEFRELASLGKRNKGTPITAAKMKELALAPGPVRVFAGGQTVADVREDAIPSKNIVRAPSIIVKSRGHIGISYYDKPFTHKSELWSYSINQPDVDQKFVYYYLLTQIPRLQEVARATSVKLPQLGVKDTDSLLIPVPPLEVQREIVKTLDQFTNLTVSLDDELELRRKQRVALGSNFDVRLRDRQLHDPSLEVVKLGNITKQRLEPVKLDAERSYVSLGVKWRGEGVLKRDPRKGSSIKAASLFLAREGQLIYNRMFVVEGSFALVPADCEGAFVSAEFPVFDIDLSRVDPYWLLQKLCNEHTLSQIEREVTGTERGSMKSRRRWKAEQWNEFEIVLPSLREQREIVSVLKASDELVRSLELEIAARRQQHEYYRDRLLTFKESEAAA